MGKRLAGEIVPGTLLVLLASILTFAGMLLALASGPADAGTTFAVNDTGDAGDRTIDGVCDSSSQGGSQCTLRAAIQEANGASGADTIRFAIGGVASVKTISPASPLPTVTDAVTIDGYTQRPCSSNPAPCSRPNTLAEGNNAVLLVQLDGTNAATGTDGLMIQADDSTVKGLVINRFRGDGIEAGGSNNKLQGNFIGTNAAGNADLGNLSSGVEIFGATNIAIGGTTVGARNVISGNREGVMINGSGATGNKVEGNYVGTDASGTKDVGNAFDGVAISGMPNNTIGGTTVGTRNVISGNDGNGVAIRGSGALGNRVEGNFMGTTADGSGDLGNTVNGVGISLASNNNTIGGPQPAQRNVISGNDQFGVFILASAARNKVEGNFVGTTANGIGDLGNSREGVAIDSAPNNTIGGTTVGTRNVISGNDGKGVAIRESAYNRVEGNLVGTNAAGTAPLGNTSSGVYIFRAPNNTVGGTGAGPRNVISGNGGTGVDIYFSDHDKVTGNYVGTNAAGTAALGNSYGGVSVRGTNNTIGGTAPGANNRIAYNERTGVSISGEGNRVLSNSIFSNSDLGIDLGTLGVSRNDTDDTDTGANRLQNFPVVTSATRSNTTGRTTISGKLDSNPSQNFIIQCFVAVPDPSGYGEGQVLAGQSTASTNVNGDASFACVSPVPQRGQVVTATATNTATGDTSEFSRNAGVVPGP